MFWQQNQGSCIWGSRDIKRFRTRKKIAKFQKVFNPVTIFELIDHQMIRNHNNAQLPIGNPPIGNPPIGNPTTSSSMIFENLLQLRQPLSQTPSSSQQYQNPNYYPNVSHHRQHQVPPPHHQNPSVLAQQQSMFLTRNFHNT